MLKRVVLCCCLAAAFAVLAAGLASAQDTSPFLMGAWNDGFNTITIINPTTKWLTVYAISYTEGIPQECSAVDIPPNGKRAQSFGAGGVGFFGTIKFFAFPSRAMKFDPNAVIGGFHRKSWEEPYNMEGIMQASEANLTAVTINSATIREFSMIPARDHECWGDN
jgi:hypothetical protein